VDSCLKPTSLRLTARRLAEGERRLESRRLFEGRHPATIVMFTLLASPLPRLGCDECSEEDEECPWTTTTLMPDPAPLPKILTTRNQLAQPFSGSILLNPVFPVCNKINMIFILTTQNFLITFIHTVKYNTHICVFGINLFKVIHVRPNSIMNHMSIIPINYVGLNTSLVLLFLEPLVHVIIYPRKYK